MPEMNHGQDLDEATFYKEIFFASPDGILLLDAESQRALVFNDAVCEQLGYSREDFANLRISDYAASEDADAVRAHVEEALRVGGTEFDTLHRTRSGDLRHVHVWARKVNFRGRPAFYTIFRDVTDHRNADENLRDSLALLTQTGRLAHVGGWQLEVASETLLWTPEVRRIHEVDASFHPSVAEAMAFYAPEGRPVIAAAVQAAIDAGTPFDVELPMVTAKGRSIWVRALGIAERSGDRTTRLVGAFQDITQRRRAEQLRSLQSAALAAAADAIVITDCEGTIEWVNPAFSELTGYSAEEARGKNPRVLVKSGRQDVAFYKVLWDTILSGRTWHGETINRRKDGTLYTEEQSITPVNDGSGAVSHFIAIKRDVSARVQLEAQFRQAQKMESVGRLAGGIAHDFNNLLTVINARADLALTDLGADDPLREELQEMLSAGERAAALTHQLLAFSRQQILVPKVLNLNAIIQGIEGLLRRTIGEDVQLAVVPAPDLRNVKADVTQVEQVIVNLVVNARDAMPLGGRLTIETQNVTVDEAYALHHGANAPPGPYVVLSVSDSGIGMDRATQAHLFEPFFTTKAPDKGTGLGLSTVHGIVSQSGGFLGVYSEVGKGSVFKVHLPAVAEAPSAPQPEQSETPGSGTETVLVVEDNAPLLKLAMRILESAGYTALGAQSGEEAMQLLQQHEQPVQLLLTDAVMPGMSGRQLVERLTRSRPEIEVLYMSGYWNDVSMLHRVADAKVRFLPKPFTAPQLLRKVREVLDT